MYITKKDILELKEVIENINNLVDEIIKEYTKQQLTDMYITFQSEKLLTSFDKRKIALTIYHSVYIIVNNKVFSQGIKSVSSKCT